MSCLDTNFSFRVQVSLVWKQIAELKKRRYLIKKVSIAVAALNYFTEFDIGVAAIKFLAAIQLCQTIFCECKDSTAMIA